ncbi:MAG TPA: hypothetical protein VM529_12035 [Gemmata sp.]|nr:hypothetical protein [Gemmata sp.]
MTDGKLVVLGVTQEQHSERCRLFAQWKGFDWPILHDPINVLGSSAVPIVLALDEHGIVRERLDHELLLERLRPRPHRTDDAVLVDRHEERDGRRLQDVDRVAQDRPVELLPLGEQAARWTRPPRIKPARGTPSAWHTRATGRHRSLL